MLRSSIGRARLSGDDQPCLRRRSAWRRSSRRPSTTATSATATPFRARFRSGSCARRSPRAGSRSRSLQRALGGGRRQPAAPPGDRTHLGHRPERAAQVSAPGPALAGHPAFCGPRPRATQRRSQRTELLAARAHVETPTAPRTRAGDVPAAVSARPRPRRRSEVLGARVVATRMALRVGPPPSASTSVRARQLTRAVPTCPEWRSATGSPRFGGGRRAARPVAP